MKNISLNKIPGQIITDIKEHKCKKPYEIPARLLEMNSSGGYLTNTLKEILYSQGMNGNQEISYHRGEKIIISVEGVKALQKIMNESTAPAADSLHN